MSALDHVPWDRRRVLVLGGGLRKIRRRMPWIEFSDEPSGEFDAVVLRRPHGDALERVGDLLAPDGVLVFEGDVHALSGYAAVRSPEHGIVVGWKRELDPRVRVVEIREWLYSHLDPDRPQETLDPEGIVAGGGALCEGYVLAGRAMLRAEGFDADWYTVIAEDVPWWSGPVERDAHEVLEVRLPDGPVVVDPTTNLQFEGSVDDLVREPARADVPREPDERYTRRGYALYTTPDWWSRVVRLARRSSPRRSPRYVEVERKGS